MHCLAAEHTGYIYIYALTTNFIVFSMLTIVMRLKFEYHANAEYENPLKNSKKIVVLVKGYFIQ